MRTRDIDPSEILAWMRESFVVDDKSGKMVWKRSPNNQTRMLGLEAGCPRRGSGDKFYVHIKWNGRAIKRGWLIFLWRNGKWPSDCLDHIDGNSTNDSADNLREATGTQNAWNHKKRKRRINLPMGVRSMPSGNFEARIACNKKMLHLGSFVTPEDAQAAYLEKRKELYGEFA